MQHELKKIKNTLITNKKYPRRTHAPRVKKDANKRISAAADYAATHFLLTAE